MILWNFEQVTPANIAALLDGKVREGRDLDYKKELPGNGNDARKEFLADVTSFANASGGTIIFGITEEKSSDGKNTGFPEIICGLGKANLDHEKLRLEQWLQSGVDPRLPGHRFHVVEMEPGVEVLVLVIQKSWFGPHMVSVGDSRFYTRNSAGKNALDATEIRTAVLQTEEVPLRLRRLRDERLALITAAETPVHLSAGGRLVLHVMPYASPGRSSAVDLQTWAKDFIPSLDASPMGGRYNADGYVTYAGKEEMGHRGYVQLLRSGAVEAVDVCSRRSRDLPVLNIVGVEEAILNVLGAYLPIMSKIGVEPPVSILLSLVGVRGFGLLPSNLRGSGGQPVVTRDVVTLPDVLLEDFSTNLTTALRPLFDALWQTFGLPQSLCYDVNGVRSQDFRW